MPNIVIDDKHIMAEQGKTIIEAAFDNGIYIPHFCWHPELTVSGNCRMCLVEIGFPKKTPEGKIELDSDGDVIVSYLPKLSIACSTEISDNMHVRTGSKPVIEAQEAVMEFLLINHPLDCPICDEAGQCKLQEYSLKYSEGQSKFIEEKKHKPKRVIWGPNVIFDAERCISCSRCIRFAKEIAEQNILSFVNRGDSVTIQIPDNQTFDNNYSMNVIDICPVGALTGRDFRFRARVWDMSFNDSICTGCGKGCNTKVAVRNNKVLRIEPRTNMYVNKYWMCDYGRLETISKLNEQKIYDNYYKDEDERRFISSKNAYHYIVKTLRKYNPNEIVFIASAKASLEDNYIANKFAKKILNTNNIMFFNHSKKSFADNFLRESDMTPNSSGLKEIGIEEYNMQQVMKLADKIADNSIKVLFTIDDNIDDYQELVKELTKLELLVVFASNASNLTNKANLVFATSNYAETEGTFVNTQGRVQHISPFLTTSENLRFMGMKMSRLDKFGAFNDRWAQNIHRNSTSIFRHICGLTEAIGIEWNYQHSEEIFLELAHIYTNFRGMNYQLLDKHQGIKLGCANSPDGIKQQYQSYFLKPN